MVISRILPNIKALIMVCRNSRVFKGFQGLYEPCLYMLEFSRAALFVGTSFMCSSVEAGSC